MGQNHEINDKVARGMVILTLVLFFTMTVIGHFSFVANQHNEEESAPAEMHDTGATETDHGH